MSFTTRETVITSSRSVSFGAPFLTNQLVAQHFSARYRVAMTQCGGRCPIEAGLIGRLADHECRHGRLPFDRTAAAAAGPRRVPPCSSCAARTRRPPLVGVPPEPSPMSVAHRLVA
jgi:hypothetical protein